MADVALLRDAGFGDSELFAITFFIALRLAFSTVNDALGARPDRELADIIPDAVRDAVTFPSPDCANGSTPSTRMLGLDPR